MGDSEAMYYLARVYMPKNKELGMSYLNRASEHGNEKALAYQNKIAPKQPTTIAGSSVSKPIQPTIYVGNTQTTAETCTNTATTAEPATPTGTENNVGNVDDTLRGVAVELKEKTGQAGIKTLAMADFLCNGETGNRLAGMVRDKVQEALLEVKGPGIKDHVDAILSTQGNEGGMCVSTAVLLGEIICRPGNDVGYLSYRVFSPSDKRILIADCKPVKWNAQEMKLLSGTSFKHASTPIPFISKASLDTVLSKVKPNVHCGMVIVCGDGANDDNSAEYRLAVAQILTVLQQGGCELYESSSTDRVGAFCHVCPEKHSDSEITVKIKVTSRPDDMLLAVANVPQSPNAIVGSTASSNNTSGIDDMFATIGREESDVQLVYEYECDITDNYMVPDDLFNERERVDGLLLYSLTEKDIHSYLITKEKVQPTAARTLMRDIAKDAFRNLGEKDKMKRFLEVVTLLGFTDNTHPERCYVGPLLLCLNDAARNLQFREDSKVCDIEVYDFCLRFERGDVELSGRFKGDACCHFPDFIYKTEVTWQDGLPSHVKCRVDFTPSKSIILRRR